VERALLLCLEQPLRHVEGTGIRLRDVDRPLEHLGKRLEGRVGAEGDQRVELRPEVDHVGQPRGGHRLDEVGRDALRDLQVHVPAGNELHHPPLHLFGRESELPREGRQRPVDQLPEPDAQPAGLEDGEDAQGVAAQAVRIGGPGGDEPHAEAAAHHVDLVRDRHRRADVRGRQVVRLPLRQVMLEDRGRDLLRLPGLQGVVPPHHPLQLGELLDDAGGEVGLAQESRPAAVPLLGGEREGGHEGGDLRHPLDLLPVGPHVGLEHHLLQRLRPVEQRDLQVVPVIELRVREARPEDPLVPRHDHLRVRDDHVRDESECGAQGTPFVLEHEILLVVPHGGDEDLPRQRQELLLEPPLQDDGELDEVRHRLHERLVLDPLHPRALRKRAQPRADPLLAGLEVDEHARLGQLPVVGVGRGEGDGTRRKEAVAVRRAPRIDVPVAERNHILPIERDDPVHGPREPDIEIGPPHRFLERDRRDEIGDDPGQHLPRFAGGLLPDEPEVFAAVGREYGERLDVDPLRLREAECGFRRLARRVECDGFRRPEDGLAPGLLPLRQAADDEGQPPRRALDVDLAEGEAGLGEGILQQLAPVPQRGADEPRRDFLAADLEQVVAFHLVCMPSSRVVSICRTRSGAAGTPAPRGS
jgi:hypothetical protein